MGFPAVFSGINHLSPALDAIADHELLALVRRGNGDAFDVLLSRYYSTIFAFAYRISGGEEAQDITQEALLKIARSIHTFRGDSKLSSWFYRITLNVARDMARSRKRQLAIKEKALSDQELSYKALKGDEISKEVRAALVSLEEKERECVVLHIYEGLKHGEIAKLVGCAESTVSWRIFNAKRKLKKLLLA